MGDGEAKVNSELENIKERLLQVEEENRARKHENDALKKMVVEQGEAHHRLQKSVDVVDNKQRVQNL